MSKAFQQTLTPGYLPMEDAAWWAGISLRTMKRWISLGLPKYQAGPRRKVLIRLRDVDEFLLQLQMTKPDLDQAVDETLLELQRGKG